MKTEIASRTRTILSAPGTLLNCVSLETGMKSWQHHPRASAQLQPNSLIFSVVFDFAKAAGGYIVDEAADGDGCGDPGMGAQLLQLVADIFLNVLERVEKGRSDGGGSGAILDAVAQIVLGGGHQSAIGVVDDHDFFRAQQVMRNDERAQGVIGDDAAGVADDVRVAGFEAERANGKARVHAGKDGEFALRAR